MSLCSFLRLPSQALFVQFILFSLLCLGISNHALANTDSTKRQAFSISAGKLSEVLRQFGLASGLSLYVDSSLVNGHQSQGLSGEYFPQQGLTILLSGTGLDANQQTDGSYRIEARSSITINESSDLSTSIDLNKIDIVDENLAFTQDEQGYNNVFDKNLSSTYVGKQELERFKGSSPADMLSGMLNVYSADARNSGGIDPNIRGIQGPGRVPLTIDGTEQAITIWRGYNGANNRSYIDPNLIGNIKAIKGPNLERNVHSGIGGAIVASTLSVDDILKPGEAFGGELKLEGSNNAVDASVPRLSSGQSYTDIPGFNAQGDIYDPTLYVEPHSGGQDYFDDYAYRLAVGTRQEAFDLMGAYAYRKKGNHFAGKHQDGFYSRGSDNLQDNMIPDMANIYKPGEELPNTSSEMESWLAKAKLKFSDVESLSFGYRDTSTTYGEIFPSRISWERAVDEGVPQWPLSEVKAKAYNVEYELNPETNRWVDLYASVWRTDTVSDTYTAGGYPNEPYDNNASGNTTLRNTALRNAKEDRRGVTLSNTFALMDNLDLTVGGRYQHEKLRSDDRYDPTGSFRMYPKAGRRQEKEMNFNFAWKPTHFLSVDAGMRYSSFWTFDDFRKSQLDKGNTSFTNYTPLLGKKYVYGYEETVTTTTTIDDVQSSIDNLEANRALFESVGMNVDTLIQQELDRVGETTTTVYDRRREATWTPDEDGKYSRDNHPCLNEPTDIDVLRCNAFGQEIGTTTKVTKVKHLKGDGWAPVLSVAMDLNDDSRIYARHSQAYRFPSLFENTVSFSASLPSPDYELKPEHIYNYEVGYVHNLAGLLDADYADIKLSYYYNRTENIIERDPNLSFSNLEKQTLEGIEFQGRYDNGGFFTNLSLAYNFENEVCDEHTAAVLDYLSTSDCVEDGFVAGYLVSMAMPEYTANWTLGGRFFNRKLELGSRVTYYYKHEDKFESNYRDPSAISYYANTPLSWDTILLFDAYASYQLNDDISVELTGTNLSNEYYIDPMSRSAIPAPGRTFKLSLTAKF